MEAPAKPFWGYIGGNKETQETHHYAVPQAPMSLCRSPSSFHLSESFWPCLLFYHQDFLSHKREDLGGLGLLHLDRTQETTHCSASFPACYKSVWHRVDISILSKAIYRVSAIYKNTNGIFHRTRTNSPKICMETQKPQNSQSKPQKNKAEGIIFLDFKLNQEATIIKAILYWHKNRRIDQ